VPTRLVVGLYAVASGAAQAASLLLGSTLVGSLALCAAMMPVPAALTVGFLLGFLLGVFLGAQLLSGFLLACGYLPDPAFAFDSVQALVRTLPGMWLLVHQQATQIAGFVFCFGPHGTHWCGERSCRCK